MRRLIAVLALTSAALAQGQPFPPLGCTIDAEDGDLAVISVDAGGLAERGGLRAGDRIDAVEGQPVHTLDDVVRLLPKFATEVRLSVIRGGKRQDLLIPLAPPPKVPDDRRPPPPDRPDPPKVPGDQPPPVVNPPQNLPANVLPYLITEKGFAKGYTTWRLEKLTDVPVAQAVASADGQAVAWIDAQAKLIVWRNGKGSEVPMPGSVSLLGWISEREVAIASGGQERAQVDAVDAEKLDARTLFKGNLAAELLPAPSCVSGYLPAAAVFARVVVGKPKGTVSFYRTDGTRHGTLVPFEGTISACSFGASFVYAVNAAGEVFPAVPGLAKQGSLGVTLPPNGGFAFSPDGRYYLATVRGAKGNDLTLTDGPSGQAQLVLAECDRGILGWQGAILLGGGDGLFCLSLVPRNAPNLAIEAREKEAAGDRDGAEAVWNELAASFPGSPEAGEARAWLEARQRERDDAHAREIAAEANRLAQVERFEEAIVLLERLRRELPRHPAAAEALKTIAALQEKIEERERQKRDELIARLMTQAEQTAVSGKLPEAIQQYESIRRQFPGLPCDGQAAERIAVIQEQMHQARVSAAVKHAQETEGTGKWTEAITEYQAIRAQFPGEPCDRDAAAKIVELEGRIQKAEAEKTAREQQALLDEGLENEKAGRMAQAVEVYEGIRTRWPGSEPSKEAVRRIGAMEAKLREAQAAEFAARMAERMETAKRLADQGDLARAKEEAQAILAADPEHGEAKVLLSAIEKSIAEVEEKARVAKADLERQVATAKALLEGGDLDGAEKAYREALGVDPKHLEAQVGLARIETERRKKQVLAQLALGKRKLELGQLDGAREAFQGALELDPGNAEATVGLLDVEEAAKKPPEVPKQPADPATPAVPSFRDFDGPAAAPLGYGASKVHETLGRPDTVLSRPGGATEEWVYASSGVVVGISRETLRVVEVQVLGRKELVAEGLRERFKPFEGRTEKGIRLGDSANAVVEAYGQAKRTEGPSGVVLTCVRESVEMSFRLEGDRVTAIVVRRVE